MLGWSVGWTVALPATKNILTMFACYEPVSKSCAVTFVVQILYSQQRHGKKGRGSFIDSSAWEERLNLTCSPVLFMVSVFSLSFSPFALAVKEEHCLDTARECLLAQATFLQCKLDNTEEIRIAENVRGEIIIFFNAHVQIHQVLQSNISMADQ